MWPRRFLIIGLLALPFLSGCERRATPAVRPATPSATDPSDPRAAAVLESALRVRLRDARAGDTVFISLGHDGTNWKDPPADFLGRFGDLPNTLKPVSMARLPEPGTKESPSRSRQVEDPATGTGAWIYFAQIEQWLSDTKVRVSFGGYFNPLAGSRTVCVFELREGKWGQTGVEDYVVF